MKTKASTKQKNANSAKSVIGGSLHRRRAEATYREIKTEWDIQKCFEQLRFNKDYHLGMGDIRLTIGMQEEICELVERFYRCC